jgi:hypothetical protein
VAVRLARAQPGLISRISGFTDITYDLLVPTNKSGIFATYKSYIPKHESFLRLISRNSLIMILVQRESCRESREPQIVNFI